MINVSKNKYVKPEVLKGELMRYLIFGGRCAISVAHALRTVERIVLCL